MAATPKTGTNDAGMNDDLSALAWVVDEVRRSLEAAHKALRRYLREAEAGGGSDLSSVDPSVLRTARTQIHQSVGALDLIGLGLAAQPLRAAEAALHRLSSRPALITPAAVQAIEKGSFALLDFLTRKLAGKPVSTLSMFPQYRALQELAGATRAHPADLWSHEWQWHASPGDASALPRAADADAVGLFEIELLGVMRGRSGAFARLSDLCAGVGLGSSGNLAALWQLASAFQEGLAGGLLQFDVHAKRVASRLLAQLRVGAQGQASDRLAQDLLFFCAQATPTDELPAGLRLSAARLAYGLDTEEAVDYAASSLGLFDPAVLAQARKRVAAAKEVWSAVAAGELARLSGLIEPFALVGDSLRRLYPNGDALARAMQALAAHCQAAGSEPRPALAMEVATALLYLEASLQDAEFDHPDMPQRVARLAQRLDDVREGREPGPLELWMEHLYRQVSDRQTMGNVVQELRASLSEVEKQIDQYFRDPTQRELLIPVPSQLSAMRGVLSLLDMDHASQAVLRMRDDVDALANTEVDPVRAAQAGTFDRLADNLGALSFLIDMVGVQPQVAKSLFRFDAATGQLRTTTPRAERRSGYSGFSGFDPLETEQPALVEKAQTIALAAGQAQPDRQTLGHDLQQLSLQARAADQHDLADVASRAQSTLAQATGPDDVGLAARELADSLQAFVNTQEGALPPPIEPSRPVPPPGPPAAPGQTGLEDDAEMREIFLEEAREVIAQARQAITALAERADDMPAMTVVRRAFHTLKGSARMVGLTAFGDAAWACEQLFNARLADSLPADADARGFTLEVLAHFERWVTAIEDGDASAFAAAPVVQSADSLRLENRWLRLANGGASAAPAPAVEPAPAPTPAPAPAPLIIDWPAAFDLDFDLDLGLPPSAAPAEPVPAGLVDLDLVAFDEPQQDPDDTAPAPLDEGVAIELDGLSAFAAFDALDEPTHSRRPVESEPEPDQPTRPAPLDAAAELPDEEPVKVIGDLRVGIPLFNIYLNEADELSRRLSTEMAEWMLELHRPAGEGPVVLAHSLAGSSATVGFGELSRLARATEHALMRSNLRIQGRSEDAAVFGHAADEIRRLLHQFAAGFLRQPDALLMQRLLELEQAPLAPEVAVDDPFGALAPPAPMALAALSPNAPEGAALSTAPRHDAIGVDEDIDAVDAIDDELFGIFQEEAGELIPQLQLRLREWALRPSDADAASACMRTLHTLKGSARLAGAMRLGEVAHRIESAVDALHASGQASSVDIDALVGHADTFEAQYESLGRGDVQPGRHWPEPAQRPAASAAGLTMVPVVPVVPPKSQSASDEQVAPRSVLPLPLQSVPASPWPIGNAIGSGPAAGNAIDWAHFAGAQAGDAETLQRSASALASSAAAVRVRGPLLDRLVNHAGEVSITRSRIETEVGQMKLALGDLTENLERMRSQLRDIELQAETQIETRLEAARASAQVFDPLEMDRFTRFQELTRMMAESVNDVATVQRGLQRTLQSTEDELVHQARLTRNLQDDLLRTRMVEFDGLSERLYRVVRQAAKETGKQVRLDLSGGSIEIDRGVLDRMTGAFEHLLRNSVVHGIELPQVRTAAGKDATGTIIVSAAQVGNEVAIDFRDDGAGLMLPRIRDKAVAMGLMAADAQPAEAELAALIFQAGFTTAEQVTGLAGRGVGMDVVRADVNAMGGRIETATSAGQGTSFRLILPLTTAVTQVVMMRCADLVVAVPSPLVELVKRVPAAELPGLYQRGMHRHADADLPFHWLAALLQGTAFGTATGRTATVVVIRSAAQRIVVHVDEVIGNQEVVVKNLGPQLSRLPGLAGMTLLPSGNPALIYNPVALSTLYGQSARAATVAALAEAQRAAQHDHKAAALPQAPLVLVVDDSLTVRRVTQRLLQREGYRVTLAKDGLDALDRLATELPALVITDIEMPRMDGFDLVRNLRAEPRSAALPVIMITSRIAQKHRDYAAELGVDHYLGKPYVEDELLGLVARYARRRVDA